MIKKGKVTRAIEKVANFIRQRAAAVVVHLAQERNPHLAKERLDSNKTRLPPMTRTKPTPSFQDQSITARKHGLQDKFNILFSPAPGNRPRPSHGQLKPQKKLQDQPNVQIVFVGRESNATT